MFHKFFFAFLIGATMLYSIAKQLQAAPQSQLKEATMTSSQSSVSPVSQGLAQIGQISVNVHDLKKAIEFYRDVLGMKFLFETPKMAFFDCSGIRLMLSLPETPEFDHPSSIIYYNVQDIQKTHEVLVSREVNFVAKPHLVARMKDHDLWLAFFRDPDNNLLALMSEVRPAR